jgi:glyoxylase-like metal-dependent hydrolase (beta-lactamase superfamily II)
MAKADYDFWTSAENEAKEKPERKLRFVASKRAVAAYGDRVKPFNPGEEIVPGIRSIAAVGHTPGHTCYMIQSSNARMLAIGDLLHIRPVQFSRPEVTIAYDSDQDRARATRRIVLDMAARENLIIAAAHLPFPGLGYVRKKGASYAFDPLPWQHF